MNPKNIIDKYYSESTECKHILLKHSQSVAKKALSMAWKHPEYHLDLKFIYSAAMLHDIGIFLTDAPGICCYGKYPYIAHGYLGADLMREEGFIRYALVCERHTGAGISQKDILERGLPLPMRDMLPVTLEEQLICFADKFFSKSNLDKEKTVEEARRSLLKFGKEGLERFDRWCYLFL